MQRGNVPNDDDDDAGDSDDVEAEEEAVRQKLSMLEEGFDKIRGVTNCSTAEEVIAKFGGHERARANLDSIVDRTEARLALLRDEWKQLKVTLDDKRYSSGKEARVSFRERVDELDKQVQSARARCDQTRGKKEQTERLLSEARVGISHLHSRTAMLDTGAVGSSAAIIATDEDMLSALEACERRLLRLVDEASSSSAPAAATTAATTTATTTTTTTMTTLRIDIDSSREAGKSRVVRGAAARVNQLLDVQDDLADLDLSSGSENEEGDASDAALDVQMGAGGAGGGSASSVRHEMKERSRALVQEALERKRVEEERHPRHFV